jgi:hypothetical protein
MYEKDYKSPNYLLCSVSNLCIINYFYILSTTVSTNTNNYKHSLYSMFTDKLERTCHRDISFSTSFYGKLLYCFYGQMLHSNREKFCSAWRWVMQFMFTSWKWHLRSGIFWIYSSVNVTANVSSVAVVPTYFAILLTIFQLSILILIRLSWVKSYLAGCNSGLIQKKASSLGFCRCLERDDRLIKSLLNPQDNTTQKHPGFEFVTSVFVKPKPVNAHCDWFPLTVHNWFTSLSDFTWPQQFIQCRKIR